MSAIPQLQYLRQVATPFSTGTGVYLPQERLIVTNEHVVRDNATVVVGGQGQELLAEVVYLDPYYDLAFLRPPLPAEHPPLELVTELPPVGTPVTALGQHFGDHPRISEGKVLETTYIHHGIAFLLHNAWQQSNHSGGPLVDGAGRLVGINMYDIPGGKERALSLPATVVADCLAEFRQGGGRVASRCYNCRKVVFEVRINPNDRCPGCGEPIVLPDMVEDYAPSGVAQTVERIVSAAGHDPRLSRRGPNLWQIRQGSAYIQVAYHEDSGLVTGDAYLCRMPEIATAELFAFLLRENHTLNQLTFSTYGRDVVLSLLIYDRYLDVNTALPRFEHLFARADDYDDVLINRFGCTWID